MARRSFLSSFIEADINGVAGLGPRAMPSAVLADGPSFIPLWAVSSLAVASSYHRPPLGAAGSRQLSDTHDDTLTLSASLIGWDRFLWKERLESVANAGVRGSVLERIPGGGVGGLVLVTSMTIRTDLYVQSLNLSASATRRDVIDVSMTLVHLPRPGPLSDMLDMAATAVGTLAEFAVG